MRGVYQWQQTLPSWTGVETNEHNLRCLLCPHMNWRIVYCYNSKRGVMIFHAGRQNIESICYTLWMLGLVTMLLVSSSCVGITNTSNYVFFLFSHLILVLPIVHWSGATWLLTNLSLVNSYFPVVRNVGPVGTDPEAIATENSDLIIMLSTLAQNSCLATFLPTTQTFSKLILCSLFWDQTSVWSRIGGNSFIPLEVHLLKAQSFSLCQNSTHWSLKKSLECNTESHSR